MTSFGMNQHDNWPLQDTGFSRRMHAEMTLRVGPTTKGLKAQPSACVPSDAASEQKQPTSRWYFAKRSVRSTHTTPTMALVWHSLARYRKQNLKHEGTAAEAYNVAIKWAWRPPAPLCI